MRASQNAPVGQHSRSRAPPNHLMPHRINLIHLILIITAFLFICIIIFLFIFLLFIFLLRITFKWNITTIIQAERVLLLQTLELNVLLVGGVFCQA